MQNPAVTVPSVTVPSVTVTTVAEARTGLSGTLQRFRRDEAAAPVVLGSHRKPEAVLMPYARYAQLSAVSDAAPRATLQQLRDRKQLILRLAALSRIESVEIFGSVARGTESAQSDVDLLVVPFDDASLFDFSQFGIDMEQLLSRSVHVVSKKSLDLIRDSDILSDAEPL